MKVYFNYYRGIDKNKSIKDKHMRKNGNLFAPEERWHYPDRKFNVTEMPPYTEKSDIWKIPDVCKAIIGKSQKAKILKNRLSKIHELCKEILPKKRPTAKDVWKMYSFVMDAYINLA